MEKRPHERRKFLAKAPTSCLPLEPGLTTMTDVGNLLASAPSRVVTREFYGARPYECAKSGKSFRQIVASLDTAKFISEKGLIRGMNMGNPLTTNLTSFNSRVHIGEKILLQHENTGGETLRESHPPELNFVSLNIPNGKFPPNSRNMGRFNERYCTFFYL